MNPDTRTEIRIEDIWGTLPTVTTAPTWVPKTFRDSFAIDTTNNSLYFYDFVDKVWVAAGTSDAHILSLFSATKQVIFTSGVISWRRRVTTTTQSATPTINSDNTDVASITGLAQAITSMTTNLSGTPVAGDSLIIEITDDATARAITWGSSFESSGYITLPTTTVISVKLTTAFLWNTITNKWRICGLA
jgi:hypothetical protein